MAEDASRFHKNPGALARMRSWALNLMRLRGIHSIHAGRQSFGWDCLNVVFPTTHFRALLRRPETVSETAMRDGSRRLNYYVLQVTRQVA
jgi:hypothetical protein